MYVDNHDAVAARLVELYYLHRLRTVEPGYLYRAHRALPVASELSLVR
ncbi:hypothetical protein I553_6750 [Mycobacterium xenopi 4042]|uniref:Uncharacterized protein n=1 Tax=Mycobacterium xenopi 4042 TaxID=1299334 RepID=X7Z3L1_MYCXE|nr:hypothetical protein I553_6750 [Mycobacterium xenopi 4042]